MILNKKAYRNYEIKETLEAGIILTGAEVKSVRDSRVVMGDSYVKVLNGELWLINTDIAKYKYSGDIEYDATRSRKLLVKRSQIEMLQSKTKQGNLTIVPLKMYFTRGKAKVLIGMARGKKIAEKKLLEKERDLERELHREKRKYVVK